MLVVLIMLGLIWKFLITLITYFCCVYIKHNYVYICSLGMIEFVHPTSIPCQYKTMGAIWAFILIAGIAFCSYQSMYFMGQYTSWGNILHGAIYFMGQAIYFMGQHTSWDNILYGASNILHGAIYFMGH